MLPQEKPVASLLGLGVAALVPGFQKNGQNAPAAEFILDLPPAADELIAVQPSLHLVLDEKDKSASNFSYHVRAHELRVDRDCDGFLQRCPVHLQQPVHKGKPERVKGRVFAAVPLVGPSQQPADEGVL